MYMSPEMIKHKGRGRVPYSFKTDIWGVGMVFAELMLLEYAFDVDNQLERINAIAKGKKFRPLPENQPQVLRTLISKMLSLDPHTRPESYDVVVELEQFI